jgi:hypothetical protein
VKQITIAGQKVERGRRACIRVPVTMDLNGSDIAFSVHVLAGAEPGPTVAILNALHGCEWQTIEFIRRLLPDLNPAEMRGNLLVVPVANPVAFCTGTRSIQDESDGNDLNRAFGGKFTWIADLLAGALEREVLRQSNYMMDFHGGNFGSVFEDVGYPMDLPNPTVVKESRDLARAFGAPLVTRQHCMTVFPGPRSSFGYCGAVLNIPNIGPEIGGAGFDRALEEKWTGMNIRGVKNVLKHLKIIDGKPELPDRCFVWEKRHRVNPTVGGYLIPNIDPADAVLHEVKKGQVLGIVYSPYTLQEAERLIAPCDGRLLYSCRSYMVRPGYWAFGVIDGTDPGSKWVTPDEI